MHRAAAPLKAIACRGLPAKIQKCGSDTRYSAAPPPGSAAIAPTPRVSTHRKVYGRTTGLPGNASTAA